MMRFLVVAITFLSVSSVRADQLTNCQSFVANDGELANYISLKPNCQLDRAALNAVLKNNPTMKYDLAAQGASGVDTLKIPDGSSFRTITLRHENDQLSQVRLDKSNTQNNFQVTDTYSFDCSTGKGCSPDVGSQTTSGGGMVFLPPTSHPPSIQMQIFDVKLCQKLKSFFTANPKAAACSDEFEKKSAEILKDFPQAGKAQAEGYPGMGPGMGGLGYPSTGSYGAYSGPGMQSNLFNTSKVALATLLYNNCQSDKRLASTINDSSVSEKKEKAASKAAAH